MYDIFKFIHNAQRYIHTLHAYLHAYIQACMHAFIHENRHIVMLDVVEQHYVLKAVSNEKLLKPNKEHTSRN